MTLTIDRTQRSSAQDQGAGVNEAIGLMRQPANGGAQTAVSKVSRADHYDKILKMASGAYDMKNVQAAWERGEEILRLSAHPLTRPVAQEFIELLEVWRTVREAKSAISGSNHVSAETRRTVDIFDSISRARDTFTRERRSEITVGGRVHAETEAGLADSIDRWETLFVKLDRELGLTERLARADDLLRSRWQSEV